MYESKKNTSNFVGAYYVIYYLFVMQGWFYIGCHRNIAPFFSNSKHMSNSAAFLLKQNIAFKAVELKF